ncbi:alpha-2-macroglobulin family protein [Roseibium algae]|uniref:Alpha-2-macroglobulin family protein n=1 Tax=Roseibium algae TaxID=3123038 RepID=A0ABU8TJ21_9HYPH
MFRRSTLGLASFLSKRVIAGAMRAAAVGAFAGFFAVSPLSLQVKAQSATQDKRIVTIEDADFFGSDYRTVKDVDLEGCKSVCLADNICRAFTFNTSANWCFLKSDFGQLQSFQGAVAGRVVAVQAPSEDQQADRKAELVFLDRSLLDTAETYAARLQQRSTSINSTADQLRRNGRQAIANKRGELAEADFGALIALMPGDVEAWARLSVAQMMQNPEDWQKRQTKQENATSSAINAYLRSSGQIDRARALDLIGTSLANRQQWKPAIKALRAALALDETPDLRRRYDQMVAEHGFRIVSNTVSADAASPQICVVFSEGLEKGIDVSPYVIVTGNGSTSVEVESAQVCVDGVAHGERYQLTVRSGLPSADGEKLEKSANLNVYVRDRAPAVHFLGRAYVLPAGGDPTIPVVSVNSSEIEAQIFRIGDRGLASAVREGKFLRQLGSYQADEIADNLGEKVWSGTVETENTLNQDVVTAIPLNDIGLEVRPGVYAMTARSKLDTKNQWGPLATQWFIVSDLGLSALSGTSGIAVNVRSLTSAEALSGVALKLLAVNNEVLGEAISDDAGFAQFAPGLGRGHGGMAPGLVIAETDAGDYSFLDLRKPAFDLSDRGVEGRPAPGPLDVFAWTDRGIYKAGETVHAQALIRTAKAVAQEGLPLTFILERPDGVEQSRVLVQDGGLGGHLHDFDLDQGAQQGVWSWQVFIDPKGDALSQSTFLVEDYQPERVDFSLDTAATVFERDVATDVSLTARYLYGSPASGQSLEGDIIVTLARKLVGQPGYEFGLLSDSSYPTREALPSGLKTDSSGKMSFQVSLPEIASTTGLHKGELVARLVEAGGRYVERRLKLPVAVDREKIGIKPLFDSGVDEGGPAEFNVILLGADGSLQSADGLSWTLSKIDRRYQWYRADGTWRYEPITTTKRVSNGELNFSADQPGSLSVPVDWGRYRLEIQSSGPGATATSLEFSAGWYMADATSETPDYLDVGLDKKSYRPGDTAVLRLISQADGIAVVNVVSGGLVSTQTLEVVGGQAEISLPVTGEWGAGAYVTASLFRPMDLANNRMPSRSIGLSWLQVDPGKRKLDVDLSAPTPLRPSTTLSVPIAIAGLQSGEGAYVTLAAVDLGILNLTGFKTPAPEDWYFGQRRLGAEMRDLYGQLIDRTAGTRGRIRSGGDAMAMRLNAPPPDEEPVALFSGLVKLDDEGKAVVDFEVPEFNGTLRLMAVAWTQEGVGHGTQDVEVRAPMVLSASLPGFLAPGDASRLRLDIDNVEGPAGLYDLTISSEGPLDLFGRVQTQQITLELGQKADVLVPLQAMNRTGKGRIYAALTAPDGTEVVKQMSLDVRDTQPNAVRRSSFALGTGESLTLDTNSFAGLRAETVSVTVTAGGAARIDVAGLLDELDRYPFGCTEQTTSRALPLLYLNQVARAAGLGDDPAIRDRVVKAIRGILANQSADGSFGLWNSYSSFDPWLDAYVADFLTRAREEGYVVPDRAFDMALSNLENRLAYVSDFTEGGEEIAYGLYVLARNGRASMGDLRYYLDAKLNAFSTPLAKAQLAASLALYGETERAEEGFRAAVLALGNRQTASSASGYRADYGSSLRDGAGVLSYVSASGGSNQLETEASDFVRTAQDSRTHYSTQDMAWLLMAARELNEQARTSRIVVNGEEIPGRLVWAFDGGDLEREMARVENRSAENTELLVSVIGQPIQPEPAGGTDYAIERQMFDLDGNLLVPQAIPVNTRVAVVVTVRTLSDTTGRLIVVDRLPAGFAIDNPRLVRSGDLGGLKWLKTVDQTDFVQFHSDRFEVSVDQSRSGGSELTFVYLARAATPGDYAHPPASVEDAYRPERRAITATSRVSVLGPVR